MNTKNIIKLVPPPRATKETIFGFNFGIRPYRKGGIRLEKELYCNKTFYHNYGHGGAGVSLAYGTASHIVELFLKDQKAGSSKDVAVIGSGYMGLMQSILLKDMGFNVEIYAKQFPKQLGVYNETACITSQVAGGKWMPFGLDIQNRPLHFKLAKTTYDYYRTCIETQKYKGLSFKPVYIIGDASEVKEFSPPGLIEVKEVKLDFGTGKVFDGKVFTTILMDGDLFLRELFEEAKSKGIKFTTKGFNDINDICKLEQANIFNCSGANSYFLFNDKNIVPIVGHILYLKKVPEIDYFLSVTIKGGKKVSLYPHSNKLGVGLTYEERGWLEKPDPESLKTVANNLNEFVDDFLGMKAGPEAKL